ncbi:MAG TPA: DUF805 domain-containing protein [Sphingomicrobium sp.]|jgi:uncharacterized membrane protein YhaH (DUF805 family)|nr:DUF805 domain-containing protein [Sphingomicrobium sp.]
MSPIDWAMRPLKKYADFSGRAPRAEYWWFYLLTVVAYIVAMILDSIIGAGGAGGFGLLSIVVMLGLLLPSLAAGVRRLHDTDRSGWWLLIALVPLVGAIVLLVFWVLEGTRGDNRFGPDPYSAELAYA